MPSVRILRQWGVSIVASESRSTPCLGRLSDFQWPLHVPRWGAVFESTKSGETRRFAMEAEGVGDAFGEVFPELPENLVRPIGTFGSGSAPIQTSNYIAAKTRRSTSGTRDSKPHS